MAETAQFGLPLLSGSQAQKHVTLNEALAVLDAVAQIRITSLSHSTPPSNIVDGEAYVVASGASGDWFGHDGKIAVATNGFWRFVTPQIGWSGYSLEAQQGILFDGADWLESGQVATENGAATVSKVTEMDHVVVAGSSSTTLNIIPQNSVVLGVTGRVVDAITGTLTSWELGVSGSPDRYGSSLGLALNSYASGLTGVPTTYYADTALVLNAVGGDFAGGTVRLAVHYNQIIPPRPV